jgi:hypothetical protein
VSRVLVRATAYADSGSRPSSGAARHLLPMGEGIGDGVSREINGVPAEVVEGKWLISGGQPAGVFEEALRGMAGEASQLG